MGAGVCCEPCREKGGGAGSRARMHPPAAPAPRFTALQGRLQRQGALHDEEAGISVSLKIATAPAWLAEMSMLLLRTTSTGLTKVLGFCPQALNKPWF